MMRDVSLRVGASESPLPGVSCIPRFSRHSKCLSKKAILSSVQNFVIAIGKPIGRRLWAEVSGCLLFRVAEQDHACTFLHGLQHLFCFVVSMRVEG